MRASDSSIKSLVAEARFVARVRALRLVRGILIGARATSMRLVPVPLRKYPKSTPTTFDALFRCYVPTMSGRENIVVNLDKYMTIVPKYPLDSPVASPFSYTIFIGDQPYADWNSLLRTFVGGENIKVRGSILVMKTDSSGVVRSMTTDDLFFVQRLVVDTLANRLNRDI